MTSIKNITVTHPRIETATDIETILCLSTLIASGELSPNGTLEESAEFFEIEAEGDCSNCPFNKTCLACIINE